jgi:hypothetical protein
MPTFQHSQHINSHQPFSTQKAHPHAHQASQTTATAMRVTKHGAAPASQPANSH